MYALCLVPKMGPMSPEDEFSPYAVPKMSQHIMSARGGRHPRPTNLVQSTCLRKNSMRQPTGTARSVYDLTQRILKQHTKSAIRSGGLTRAQRISAAAAHQGCSGSVVLALHRPLASESRRCAFLCKCPKRSAPSCGWPREHGHVRLPASSAAPGSRCPSPRLQHLTLPET